ncbi:hypothetical protein GCM10020254_01400 [Streptomyces goshikiensis]
MERALAALDGCGLSGAEAMDSVVLVAGHVRGIAEQERAMAGGGGGGVVGPGGRRARCAACRDAGRGVEGARGRLPGAGGGVGIGRGARGQEQALLYGLERILDGLGLLVERRGR